MAPGFDSRGLVHAASDSESIIGDGEAGRPWRNAILSLKTRAGVDGSGNTDPHAFSCNSATQGLCLITPHLARQRKTQQWQVLRELWPLPSSKESLGSTLG